MVQTPPPALSGVTPPQKKRNTTAAADVSSAHSGSQSSTGQTQQTQFGAQERQREEEFLLRFQSGFLTLESNHMFRLGSKFTLDSNGRLSSADCQRKPNLRIKHTHTHARVRWREFMLISI